MNKMRRFLSVTLAVSMILSMGTSVMAEEVKDNYEITYKVDEVTDTDKLIEMALANPTTFLTNGIQKDIAVEQLLEVREYNDGRVEKSYVKTGIALADENGNKVSLSNLNTKSSTSGSDYGYNIGLHCNLYYTETSPRWFRLDSVQTVVTGTGYGTSPSNGYHFYNVGPQYLTKTQTFSCSSSSTQYYTLYSAHSGSYPSVFGASGGLVAASLLTLSNGSELYAQTALNDM